MINIYKFVRRKEYHTHTKYILVQYTYQNEGRKNALFEFEPKRARKNSRNGLNDGWGRGCGRSIAVHTRSVFRSYGTYNWIILIVIT